MPDHDAQPRLRIFNLCSWGGLSALVVTLIGWLIAGLLPLPLGPSSSLHDVVAFYPSDSSRRMVGFVLATLGVSCAMPMIGVITMHMTRMERRLPLLALIQRGTGSVTMLINLLASMPFAGLTFRPCGSDAHHCRSGQTRYVLNPPVATRIALTAGDAPGSGHSAEPRAEGLECRIRR